MEMTLQQTRPNNNVQVPVQKRDELEAVIRLKYEAYKIRHTESERIEMARSGRGHRALMLFMEEPKVLEAIVSCKGAERGVLTFIGKVVIGANNFGPYRNVAETLVERREIPDGLRERLNSRLMELEQRKNVSFFSIILRRRHDRGPAAAYAPGN